MPLQLIPGGYSPDTIQALEALLENAKRGDIIGIAFAVLLRRQRFVVDCSGEACENPALARGAVAVLDDHLGDLIRGYTDRDTTI